MKNHRPRMENPLSFSVLDLVMGLVGVILIASFALAAQPVRKSNQQILRREIIIKSDTLNKNWNIGIGFKIGASWITPTERTSKVEFTHPEISSLNRHIYIPLKVKIKTEDIMIIHLISSPSVQSSVSKNFKVFCLSPKSTAHQLVSLKTIYTKKIEIIKLKDRCKW